ncbi:MAG: cytochrome c biogenesis protein CcsA [Bacteroidia bacterium]|nr:cytochrome c biogenesis protein CcsA [Bacteroidia bacterium]
MQLAGEIFVGLLWVSGLWGAIAAWEGREGQPLWRKSAWGAWILHTIALLSTIGLLLYILIDHRYEFYYAWAHGSRQLSPAYTTAALWEGQEGSFLLWMLWHGIVGWALLIGRDPYRWPLVAGLSAVNGYLATFLLGLSFPSWVIASIGGLLWGLWAAESLPWHYRIGGTAVLIAAVSWSPQWLKIALLIGTLLISLRKKLSLKATIAAWALLLIPTGETWGSFPFLYLWEARAEIIPGEIPLDGNGLNPLLQSYWMVIHPPVLFGGYAATALPFWEGLLVVKDGKLTLERSRRLLRFLWIAVGLLGLGIALGAYWAYETLNFGGYWNWDPVENASLAPWLVLVAAAHLIWVWRKERKSEGIALAFATLPFPLVLYSSYLTRSGVLADSSVHSFTDLGLGNWLLWGVGLCMGGGILLIGRRLPRPPFPLSDAFSWSALRTGSLLLTWVAFILLLFTSLPALNKLFGSSWALGANSLQIYYEWMGLFSVPLLGLMGYGLLKSYRAKGWEAVAWSGGGLLAGCVGFLWWKGWDFVYHPLYRTLLEGTWPTKLRGAFFLLLDDLLWGAAWIALGGAIAVFLQRPKRIVASATLAHGGFALLIMGALLSSGYEKVLSANLNPRSPGAGDNLFLPLGGEASALGYLVRYEGLLQPLPPLRRLEPLLKREGQTLWRFTDSLGFPYQSWLPDFLTSSQLVRPVALPSVQTLIESNLALLPVEPADRRYRYRVTLTDLQSQKKYPLLLEADLSEETGLLAHPSHIRLWTGDLYVHLTSLPRAEGAALMQGMVDIAIRDTITWEDITLSLERLTEVEGTPHPTFRAWFTAWKGLPAFAQRFPVEFAIQEKELRSSPASVGALGLTLQLEGFLIDQRKLRFRAALRRQPDAFITLKILYKPFIWLFWGGIGLTLIGVVWAIFRHRKRG